MKTSTGQSVCFDCHVSLLNYLQVVSGLRCEKECWESPFNVSFPSSLKVKALTLLFSPTKSNSVASAGTSTVLPPTPVSIGSAQVGSVYGVSCTNTTGYSNSSSSSVLKSSPSGGFTKDTVYLEDVESLNKV